MIKISQINIPAINLFPAFKGKIKQEQSVQQPSSLERSPQTDVVKISKKAAALHTTTLKNYEKVIHENILGEELNAFLAPQKDSKGNDVFTAMQTRIINLAAKKIDFYKDIALRLEKDGNESIGKIIKHTKKVFGGDKELGKYLHSREKDGVPCSKDSVSIYNKIIKEFKEKYIYGQVLDGLAMSNWQRPYNNLDKNEKELLKLCAINKEFSQSISFSELENVLKSKNKEYNEVVNWVKDLIGLRLILPDDFDMSIVEKYLTKAILTGELNITKISNYHSSHIYPYISQDTLKMWKQVSPGILIANSSNIRRKNGYTTTQMNILFKIPDKSGKEKTIRAELQIRSESLNKLGQIEHLIYDILENKNIGKNIQELEEFYESTGIVDAVKEVFNDPQKENSYLDYEKTTYTAIRENEKNGRKTNNEIDYPLLADFGLGQYDVLSFESLDYIDKKANKIKQKYGHKNQ